MDSAKSVMLAARHDVPGKVNAREQPRARYPRKPVPAGVSDATIPRGNELPVC